MKTTNNPSIKKDFILTTLNNVKDNLNAFNESIKNGTFKTKQKKALLTRNAQLLKMISLVDNEKTIVAQSNKTSVNAGYLVEDLLNLIINNTNSNIHSCNDSTPDLIVNIDNEYLNKGTYEIKYCSDYSRCGKVNLSNDYPIIMLTPVDIRLVNARELNIPADGRPKYKDNLEKGVRLDNLYNLIFN